MAGIHGDRGSRRHEARTSRRRDLLRVLQSTGVRRNAAVSGAGKGGVRASPVRQHHVLERRRGPLRLPVSGPAALHVWR